METFFLKLKEFRRVATRYDKRADRSLAFVHLGCMHNCGDYDFETYFRCADDLVEADQAAIYLLDTTDSVVQSIHL